MGVNGLYVRFDSQNNHCLHYCGDQERPGPGGVWSKQVSTMHHSATDPLHTCTSFCYEAPRLRLVVLSLLENDIHQRMQERLESRRGSKKILIHACKTFVGRVQRSAGSWLDEDKGRSRYVLMDAVAVEPGRMIRMTEVYLMRNWEGRFGVDRR